MDALIRHTLPLFLGSPDPLLPEKLRHHHTLMCAELIVHHDVANRLFDDTLRVQGSEMISLEERVQRKLPVGSNLDPLLLDGNHALQSELRELGSHRP